MYWLVILINLVKKIDYQLLMLKTYFLIACTPQLNQLKNGGIYVFGLGEGGDFHHKCLCGEQNFD